MTPSYIELKSKRQSRFGDQRGQALVEYVLLVIVSVSLVIAVTTAFFVPFQSFIQSYIGDYIECLLDMGELPSFGDETSQQILQAQNCNSQFKAATFSAGRPANGTNTSVQMGGGAGGSGSSNSANSGANGSGSSSGGGGGAGAGGAGGRANYLNSRSNGGGRGAENGNSKQIVTDLPPTDNGSAFYKHGGRNFFGSSRGGRDRYVFIYGMTAEEKKKLVKKESGGRTVTSIEGENLANSKKFTLKKPPPKKEEIPDTPMGFSDFLRLLIIVAIVIAILVVLGSQALKISKSWEK